MKGFASGLLFLSSLIGFTAPWGSGRRSTQQPIEPDSSVEVVSDMIVDDATLPTEVVVNEATSLQSIIESYVTEEILTELALYEEFATLDIDASLEFEYQNTKMTRILVNQSDYERLRIELTPVPTIMLDTYPLDAKSLVMTFGKKDLFEPTEDLLDILDAEPGLYSVIDSQVDIIKKLSAEDEIEVLAVGRYRGDHLEYLESVLSVRINQSETSSLLFKYEQGNQDYWYGEDLEPRTYPFIMSPTDYVIISSKFGVKRGHKTHKGIDFAAEIGTPIYAAASGVIEDTGWGTGYGLRIKIEHEHLGDYATLYAHLSRAYVKAGDVVRQGQLIGLVGNTGRSTGPHLHYELHKGHQKINPRAKSVSTAFAPEAIDSLVLEEYRDNLDRVFVQATEEVVDVSSLLAYHQSAL